MAIAFYWRFTRLCIPVLTASTAILLLGIVASTLMLPGSAVAIDLPASRWVRVDMKPDPMMENLRIPADAATSGMWSDVFSWPMNGLHSMVLPDGKVLTFGTISDGRAQDGRLFDVWDPSLGFGNNSHASSYQAQQQDSFCATAAYLQDGTLLITGGNSRNGGYGNGATIFDPANNVRTTSAASTALPRWYSTMLTLPDSRQLVIGGMKP